MRKLQIWRNLAISFVLAGPVLCAHAVDTSGRIRGTVTDPSGAVIPNAPVTAKNEATGVIYTTVSQPNGDYQFLQLPVGKYDVSVSISGFKAFTATGITLDIDQQYVEPIKLELGSSSDKVEVSADSVQVDTTNMQLSNVVDASQIVAYPLIGRAFTTLEQILPGVQAADDRFGSNYSVNGAQSQQSSYLINGADTNDFALNTIGIQPNLDGLDQFNVITSSLNAEYSRNSGAIVSTVVKAGTNQFHGDVFEFYRDTFLNSKNFFQKTAPIFHQNLFGGTIGGPILKDKLFGFFAYQGDRARSPEAGGNTKVLTAAQRGGDFTGTTFSKHVIPGTINIPGCTAGVDTWSACLARIGTVPTSAFNPIAAALLTTYVPLPNTTGGRYLFNPITTQTQDQYMGRGDYSLNSNNQFYFVGIFQKFPTARTLPFTGSSLPGFGDQNTSAIHQFTASYTRQINATTLNEFLLHYTRFNFGSVEPQKVVLPSTAGFNITPQNAAAASFPKITVNGFFTLGFSNNGPQPRVDQNYQVDDNFSKVLGHHSLKFGYDGRQFSVDNEFSNSNNGSFGFSTSNPNSSGSAALDYLLGNVSTYAQGAGGRISAKATENYFYAQDSWKVRSNLTVNYGMGYQLDTPIRNNQYGGVGVNCFVPGQQSKVFPTAPISLNFPGDPGCNNAQGATTPYTSFGPRLGFAFTPDLGFLSGGNSGKLSIRAGYGIYYNRTEEESSLQNLGDAPFGVNSSGVGDYVAGSRPQFANPYADIQTGKAYTNKFPATFPKPGQTVDFEQFGTLFISQYNPGFRAPYAENFNLTIERELPSNIVATASYVGALGRHNQITFEGNPITLAGHNACLADAVCSGKNLDNQASIYPTHTLYPQAIDPATGQTHFHGVGLISTEGSSNYNALELSAKKGPTHGLEFQISYTLSHSLDDSSSYEGAGFGGSNGRGYNQFNKTLNYGNSTFDARHRLVIAPIYTVPYNAAGSPLSLRNLLGAGWQVTGIVTFASGFPFDISYGGGVSYSLFCAAGDSYYACPDVPNQVAPLQRVNPRLNGSGQFFDGRVQDGTAPNASASFAQEALGTFGNIARNKYHGPGTDNTDMVLAKNIHIASDSQKFIQLRIEGYNVFNHTNFTNPDGNVLDAGATFGQIQSAAAGREFQLVGRFSF